GTPLAITFTDPPATAVGTIVVLLIYQDATGSRTVTWPTKVKWPGGTAPTLTTTASQADMFAFLWNGTNYAAVQSGGGGGGGGGVERGRSRPPPPGVGAAALEARRQPVEPAALVRVGEAAVVGVEVRRAAVVTGGRRRRLSLVLPETCRAVVEVAARVLRRG